MDVVEKDLLGTERRENAPHEVGAQRKSVARALPSSSSSKVNRLPALHERGAQSKIDGRRYLSESSKALQSFVAPLEEQVRSYGKYRHQKHRSSAKVQAKVAELVLHVIRQLAFKETGVFNLEAPVPQLLSTMFAGSVEVGIVTGLARRAHKALVLRDTQQRDAMASPAGVQSSRGLSYDVARELDELVMLLKWYVRRKMSLYAIDVEALEQYARLEAGVSSVHDERDSLFALDVMHDHQVFGVKGCLLTCGVRLLGRDGEALWLRVSLLSGGEPVMARSEWMSWTDPGGNGAVELLPEHMPFCSLVPIRPNSQRLVIDEVRAFVPYAALQLPSGRSEVEVVVTVINGDGHEVLTTSRLESICVPHRQLRLAPVPAPHALGMWPHDVVSGDKISELAVTSGFKTVAGWERHSISVAFDLSLFMHAGESVMLECRFVNAQGSIVELTSLGMPFVASELNVAVESLSAYRYRRVLHPKGAWALYQGLCIDIPVEFLLLAAGTHEITCELVVVSADDRVLCGDMSRVVVHVPDRLSHTAAQRESGSVSLKGSTGAGAHGRASINLDGVEIDSAWQCGGDDCIRVQATFSPHSQAEQLADLAAGRVGELFAPYRVEISLEREDGHVLLQAYSDALGMSFKPVTRAVCVDPYTGHTSHTVVANFKREEVLGWSLGIDGGRLTAKARLFARVTAFSLTGDVLVSESKELFVKPLIEGTRQVVRVTQLGARIVDVTAWVNAQGERVTSRALINVPVGDTLDEGVRVQFVLCSPGGGRDVIATKDIPVQQGGVWTRQVTGLCQYAVDCECKLPDGSTGTGRFIEASIVARDGEVLHTVEQAVRAAGVLSEVDENAADFDSDLASPESSSELQVTGASGGTSAGDGKGLWGRLFGR